jgi:hypothetical protein
LPASVVGVNGKELMQKLSIAPLMFVFTLYCLPSNADEYYEFYKVTCDEKSHTLTVEPTAIWNIGTEVWPGTTWDEHVAGLKILEKKGLYVFDQGFGYWDVEKIIFHCGKTQAQLTYEHTVWEATYREDAPREIRGNPTLSIYSSSGKVLDTKAPGTTQRNETFGLRVTDGAHEISTYPVKMPE